MSHSGFIGSKGVQNQTGLNKINETKPKNRKPKKKKPDQIGFFCFYFHKSIGLVQFSVGKIKTEPN